MPRAWWLEDFDDYVVVHSCTVEEERLDMLEEVAMVLSRWRMQARLSWARGV